jgi:glutamine amidotransferase
MITILDYAINNLHSVEKAFHYLQIPVEVASQPERILAAEKLVLPGVGAYADAMANLENKGLVEVLKEKVRQETPILGVCLGLQLFFSESEEFGQHSGLDFLPGKVKRLPATVSVPHIGWNQLHLQQADPLLDGIADNSFVYFVHSYYADAASSRDILATTDYGLEFPAIVRRGNVWATQFHPEKSQDIGLRLLTNFADI